ncbi:MAG: D-tyrosyl-tRNA(Tyr) deacylase [Ruminococcaceae bacterium]|nr:D-tyrosyl-tRNA(Tyr) deacylase [Oscillospiraceae bacterium]
MKIVLQRVLQADVKIEEKIVGEIGKGYLALLGIEETDNEEIAEKMADKLQKLRVFEDENGKTNLSAEQVNGEILVVSQFTLCADCRKGNRPSFIGAARPEQAIPLYEYFLSLCAERFCKIAHGTFGADMKVSLVNDGPFTILLDSKEIIVSK